jgi:four helix bundle protein
MSLPYRTYSFEKLHVWQQARELKLDIYRLTQSFPREELYGLTSQLRRAADSVTGNLAEGSGRASNVDKAHFSNISHTSCLEIINHAISSYDVEYISGDEYVALRVKVDKIITMLENLYKYQLNHEVSLKEKVKSGGRG